MAKPATLEPQLDDLFGKKAPQMPAGGRKFFVDVAPWLSLVVGVLTLLSAWTLWHWAHAVNDLSNYANSLCNSFGGNDCSAGASRLSFWVWLTLIVVIVEGVLYLLAFPGLRDRKKSGWNYVYYAALVNVAYAIVNLFSGYNAVGNFIGALIGSAIGFWILFQIRSNYTEAPAHASVHGPNPPTV